MKLIIDIPDSDYTAVRCEALYYIGHDKLAESVTTAFQTAIPYEEKQGKWKVYARQGGIPISDYCTNCKYEMKWYRNKYNYCPNCGAKMKGGAE